MKQQGRDPLALKTMPVVPAGYHILLKHFNRLSHFRTYNMSGPNPIDFQALFLYNQAIARLDLEFFIEVIQMLDNFYLNKSSKNDPAAPPENQK